jgi:hypothetical protein
MLAAGAAAGWQLGATSPARGAAASPGFTVHRAYSGRITGATGHLVHASGAVTIDLRLHTSPARQAQVPAQPPTAVTHYRAVLTIHGACGPRDRVKPRRCLRLDGTLVGAGSATESNIPDTGGGLSFRVGASNLPGLGAVVARCAISGVGFIETGHRTIVMTLRLKDGAEVHVAAAGPPVPGGSGL